MSSRLRMVFITALMLTGLATVANADIKIKTRNSISGQTSEGATYIKGKRQRSETYGGMVSITQCDLRRSVTLNDQTKTYMVSPFDNADEAANVNASAGRTQTTGTRRGGIITSTITSTDTGERKQMFGYTARRIKTSMVTESSPDACNKSKSRVDSDGWYIDLAVEFNCLDKTYSSYNSYQRPDGCRDEYRTKQIGTARMGYAVQVTTTIYDDNGQPSTSFTQEVIEISKAVLDASLFDVPAGYTEVKNAQEMYSASAIAAAAKANSSDDDASDSPSSAASTLPLNTQAGAQTTAATLGPKKPGVIRVGVAMTRATAAGEGIDTALLAGAVHNTMVSRLGGTAVEVLPLTSQLPSQIGLEASEKECDFVLYTTVAHKKGGGGGGFGSFIKKAAPITDRVVPMASARNTGAAIATNVVYTASDISGSVKSKDELTLEYDLQRAPGGASAITRTLKAKAKSDGEDLVSQVVGQAAAAILAEASKK